MQKTKWILVTAGLGSVQYNKAAQRIRSDFERMGLNFELIIIDENNLKEYCPSFSSRYENQDAFSVRGYGYWYWKVEAIARIFETNSSTTIGLVWVDSGNEIFPSYWSRQKFIKIMHQAINSGAVTYALRTEESKYTKQEVLEYFKNSEFDDYQFQANFFILYGDLGRKIATQWFQIVKENPELLDDSTEFASLGFVEHRHDQSVFSLVCKSNGFQPSMSPPPTGRNGFKSIIKAALYPVWVSRNRTGDTIRPKWLTTIGRLTLKQGKNRGGFAQ